MNRNLRVVNKLLYGESIQFKHIASGLYLTLDTSKSYELTLDQSSKYSVFKIWPVSGKSKQINEPITYEDTFNVKNVNGKDEYYLE